MSRAPLEELDTESVSNVYIFLADALRYDSLPEEVSERGTSFKTVAHALATPQCLPTIVSGRLPPRHGVEWFIHTMPSDLPTVFDIEGHNTGYSELLWPGSALQDVLRNPEDVDIESVEEPFVVFEHDNGGHAPYPETDAGDPEDMLRGMDPKTDIRERYRKTVSGSATRFSERLGILDDRGLLDDTLVIFIADHGQLLGEHGGFFGHGLPMTPEVAYVPTTFIHPSLPSGKRGGHLLHQVDLYPTIVQALTDETPESDGDCLLEEVAEDRPAYSQGLMLPPDKHRGTFIDPAYDARSIWTLQGGHVFVQNSKFVRCITAVYEGVLSGNTAPFNHNQNIVKTLWTTFSHYLKDYYCYGTPSLEKENARGEIESIDTDIESVNERKLDQETKEQLADLGYH